LALILTPSSQGQGIFPLTLIPSWESVHHWNELAGIGSFLLTVLLVYLALRPPWSETTADRIPSNGVAPPTQRLGIRRLRRPMVIVLAFVFGFLTIASFLYAGQPQPLDVHLATAYWYRNDLEKINNLIAEWDRMTKKTLENYLANRGEIPYSPDIDLGGIEANIKELVRNDFLIELDFSRHPKFDANSFYSAPNVDQISKDSDKQDYRRLYDQYSQAKYTINQVVEAYKLQISMQNDYIIENIKKPNNCFYQREGPGNFGCRY
jgi:hypothetical protein